jgi:hypothetical protein
MEATASNNPSRSQWSDASPLSGASYERVTTTVACVLTRFKLPSIWLLPQFFLKFRRVRREAANLPGLITTVFLVEDLKTCYTLSLWTDDAAISEFGVLLSHIFAANWSIRHIYRKDSGFVPIWSAQWRLWALGRNLHWDNINIRTILAEQGKGDCNGTLTPRSNQ